MHDIVKNLSACDCKNSEDVLNKLSGAQSRWTPRGEFIYRGSHMIDLVKHRNTYTKSNISLLADWAQFPQTLLELNISFVSTWRWWRRRLHKNLMANRRVEERSRLYHNVFFFSKWLIWCWHILWKINKPKLETLWINTFYGLLMFLYDFIKTEYTVPKFSGGFFSMRYFNLCQSLNNCNKQDSWNAAVVSQMTDQHDLMS